MTSIARKSDGRRIFTDEFKQRHIARVWRGDITLAGLSRKLGIARSLLQRWKRLMPQGAVRALPPRERAATTGELRATQYIRELQLLVGRQTVELEHLRTELSRFQGRRREL
jgi:transposase